MNEVGHSPSCIQLIPSINHPCPIIEPYKIKCVKGIPNQPLNVRRFEMKSFEVRALSPEHKTIQSDGSAPSPMTVAVPRERNRNTPLSNKEATRTWVFNGFTQEITIRSFSDYFLGASPTNVNQIPKKKLWQRRRILLIIQLACSMYLLSVSPSGNKIDLWDVKQFIITQLEQTIAHTVEKQPSWQLRIKWMYILS